MPINDFTEKKIRKSIVSKVNPKITSKGKHWKGAIYHKGKLVGKVKIPNDHNRVMKSNKSKYIAEDLNLDHSQFNLLVECPLSGKEFYSLMDNYI